MAEPGSSITVASLPPRRWLLLDALVVFLGAFLLFLIQPIYSKFILPWFGGAPLVWATALVFFQTALLAGYAYAHFLAAKLRPRGQMLAHASLLLLSLAFLPVAPSNAWKPAGDAAPSWEILAMLVCTLGLPYLLLASTSPLVQAWIARHRRQMVPYRLFGLSNLASLLGLLSYPFLIEPAIGLGRQFTLWAWGYGLYAAAMAALLLLTARTVKASAPAPAPETDAAPSGPPSARTQLLWVALPACPSVLLIATTEHLTLDVAPVPFLWVLPLVLYLLTFVVCFEFPQAVPRRLTGFLAVGAGTALALLVALPFLSGNFSAELVLACGAMFVMTLFCHAELYARRPCPSQLTRFYLMASLGGALGGVFVGLLAHRLFTGYYEIYVGLAGCLLLVFYVERERAIERHGEFEVSVASAMPLCAAALVVALPFTTAGQAELRAERNFFGALRVVETTPLDGSPGWLQLDHGSTKHGLQFLPGPQQRCLATTYFSQDSGAGRVLRLLARERDSIRAGIIGLGVGTLATFSRPEDRYVFYEINPLIEEIARENFTFLSECSQGAEVRLGDARIQLEAEAPNRYDVLLLDAFSGDSIPVHLLTHEAFRLYAAHLSDSGVMAVNISNRYLDLRPVVRSSARVAGFEARFIASSRDPAEGSYAALWAILARDTTVFGDPLLREAIALTPQPSRDVAWTDDFSNLFSVLGADRR